MHIRYPHMMLPHTHKERNNKVQFSLFLYSNTPYVKNERERMHITARLTLKYLLGRWSYGAALEASQAMMSVVERTHPL